MILDRREVKKIWGKKVWSRKRPLSKSPSVEGLIRKERTKGAGDLRNGGLNRRLINTNKERNVSKRSVSNVRPSVRAIEYGH